MSKGVKRTKPAHKAHLDNRAERAIKEDAALTEVQAFTAQLLCDLFIVAMNDAVGFGYSRCKKVIDQVTENYIEYCKIWKSDTSDREYAKAVIDRRLKEICGDNFEPWEKRYS